MMKIIIETSNEHPLKNRKIFFFFFINFTVYAQEKTGTSIIDLKLKKLVI
jgi:hypothetical protein